MINYYGKMKTTELGAYIEETKAIGGNSKYSSASQPGTRRYSLYHEGVEPRGWSLVLSGMLDAKEASVDSIIALFNTAVRGDKFYPYRADKFARVLKSDAWEGDSSHYHQPRWGAEAVVYADTDNLFAEASTVWYPQYNEKRAITGAGTVAAPIDSLTLIGQFVNGSHVVFPKLQVWNAAGTTLEDSVELTDELLTDEVLTLDYKGTITQVYTDPFTSTTKFLQDATNEGCSIGDDGLLLGTTCSATWKLSGPWPLSKNITITGSIQEGTGNIYLLYSYDNVTYRQALADTDLIDETTWTIPQTRGHGDIWIRFATYGGESDSSARDEADILADITTTAATKHRADWLEGVWGRTYNAGWYMLLIKLDSTKYAYQIQAPGGAYAGGVDPSVPWEEGTAYEAALDLYNTSEEVAVTNRSDAQILADIVSPTITPVTPTLQGVWGRVYGASTYMFIIKLDANYYAYQIQQAGEPNYTAAWAIGTSQQACQALYNASVLTGNRTSATILAEIQAAGAAITRNAWGFWGRSVGAGIWAYVVKVDTNTYAYQYQGPGSDIIYTNPWYIGTALQAAQDIYSNSPAVGYRSRLIIYNDILSYLNTRDVTTYYNGVWGRTDGDDHYMLLTRLEDNLYAYQIQPPGPNPNYSNPVYIGTRTEAAIALYNASAKGPRTITDISNSILNATFGDYNNWDTIKFGVYGPDTSNAAEICKVVNHPATYAYRLYQGASPTTSWEICDDWETILVGPNQYIDGDTAGKEIADALIAASTAGSANTRTVTDIYNDITAYGFVDPKLHDFTVDGPTAGAKPTATLIKINDTPQAFAYRIQKADGTYTAWTIDDLAGGKTAAALIALLAGARTLAQILAEFNGKTFQEPSVNSWTAYGYVDGAMPKATILQLYPSPQKLVYQITSSTGAVGAWTLEANAGMDCRTALTAGWTGISSRTLTDIWNDILSKNWKLPSSYSWTVYGLTEGVRPYAEVIQCQDSGPKVLAYQMTARNGAIGSWAFDELSGVTLAALLEADSEVESSTGSMVLESMTITQERMIPYHELPVVPLDGLAHKVQLLNGPDVSSAYLKATASSIGATEVFTVAAISGNKVSIRASTLKYLSSNFNNYYVTAIKDTVGADETFELVLLGTNGANNLYAIRTTAGLYLSVPNAATGFVYAQNEILDPISIFEFISQDGATYAIKVSSHTESLEPLVLDEGALDETALDGAQTLTSTYAGKYFSAVSGTLTGVNPVTMVYRDRYYI